MNKDQGFDMLDNADNKTIERLSEVPVLTEREKERILKMSKEKFGQKYGNNNIEDTVRGVEVYKRPKWYSFAAAAACMVLAGGIIGTGVLIGRNSKTTDSYETKFSGASVEPSETTSAATEPVTTAVNEDLSDTVTDLFNQRNELAWLSNGTHIGFSITDNVTIQFDGEDYTYCRIVDDRFSDIDSIKNYFQQTVTGTVWLEGFSSIFSDNFSPARFKVFDGEEYVLLDDAVGTENYSDADYDVFTDIEKPEISNVTDNRFEYSFNAKHRGADYVITGSAVREDDKWKIDFYQVAAVSVIPVESTEENTEPDTEIPSETESAENETETNIMDPTEPDVQETENTFASSCRSEVERLWNETRDSSGGSASIEYTFYDIDGDGSSEFLFKYGTFEADFRINVYTYKHGYLEYITTLGGGHTVLEYDEGTGELVIGWGHMGSGEYAWYKLENNELVNTRRESVDYTIIGKEDVEGYENVSPLPVYGAYSYADGSVVSFSSDKGSYQEIEGFDLSFIQ